MRERTKLYVDMLKAATVGFLGAASFAGAWRLTGAADQDKDG